jgi:hypothetical protein
MALTRLTNLIASRNGRMIYVNPDDFNASDLISNTGNSPTRPFKTLQRAILEVARFSYVAGQNNDKYDQFTINLYPGDYVIDNRPGLSSGSAVPELNDQSNFNILDPNNDLYKFNSVDGGLVVPRGTSIVGMDLRKTRIRPRYVPQPDDPALEPTSIFRVTGACYFWQFSLFDALQLGDVSGLGGVYRQPTSTTLVNADYSHHKVTCFTYADQDDLNLFYDKAAKAFANIPDTTGELAFRVQENRIVGPLQQAGQKSIATLLLAGTAATFTTIGDHELFLGQQVTIEDITGTYSALNGTFYVADVPDDNTFILTSTTFSTIPSGSALPADLTSAIVKAEIDTVDSSSPYIFNCSLRSTYGLCGLWADGSKVTGFKSMVVAQFTGVSLQKDDNAFVKFTETLNPPQFVLNGGSSDAVSLHQDAGGYVYYRENWRHYHIRVSNNSFIQSVSVFAVGYAEQHLIESGGDYSITNSNSNFGTTALIADGFRPDAFALDKKGYISHIVPPQSLLNVDNVIPYYPLDVQKTRDGVATDGVGDKIYLYDQIDPDTTPAFNINQNKIGGRVDDRLYVRLSTPATGSIDEYQATIQPNGVEEKTVSAIGYISGSSDDNVFTTSTTNNFETATPLRIYSDTGYLPLGMESNKIYYAVRIDSTRFKISPTPDDARAAAGGSTTSVVNIRSGIPLNANITVKAYVSDTVPDLPNYEIAVDAADTPSGNSFSTGTYNHGFSTGDRIFFGRRRLNDGTLTTGSVPLIQSGGATENLSLATIYYVIVLDGTTFRIATTEANAVAGNNILLDSNGDANTLKVYRDIEKSPLRYDPSYVTGTTTIKGWYISVAATGNTIHPVFTSSNVNNIYANPTVLNTENAYIKRVPDSRRNADRTYRLRYVIPRSENNARPPLLGYVIKRKTDSADTIIAHESATNSEGVTSTTNDFSRVYYIYKIDTILEHIPGEQDGVYYLTVLLADVAPKGTQFGSLSDTFGYLKYSQDVSKIYPDLDKDNPIADPDSALSVADNLVQGYVYQDDNKKSVTKEAVETFLSETGYSPSLASLSGKAVSGQENRLIGFNPSAATIQVELRRTSQIRAGNQTFEYTGFNSGNYSTGFPSKQEKVLSDREILYSQSQKRRAGIVFYSGLNSYGDLYVGNQKINSVTGEVEILDQPILTVSGSPAGTTEEYVPYLSDGRSVDVEGALTVQGNSSSGSNTLFNAFNNETKFNEGISVSTKNTTNRALITQDLTLRVKQLANVDITPNNGNIKQIGVNLYNSLPTPGIEGTFRGDLYYKPYITSATRNQSYVYTGQVANSGWAQTGLVGTGHLTSIEDSYVTVTGATTTTPEYYQVTGKFGINKTSPTASLHVGTGDSVFDNDVAINGGDLTSTSTAFNLLNQPTEIDAFTSSTDIEIGASTGTFTVHNAVADFDGDVNIDGGDLTTNETTFNLLNTNATTVNAFGVATDIQIGASTGSTNIRHDLNVDGGDITTTQTEFNLLNTNATTVNAFGSATRVNIAAENDGYTVVRNNLAVVGNLLVNGSTTNVESTTITVKDPVISLGASYIATVSGATTISGVTVPGVAPGDSKDRGVEFTYVAGGVTSTGFYGWDTSAENYKFLTSTTNSNDVITGTNGIVEVGQLRVDSPAGMTSFTYQQNPFANFTAGQYSAASNTDVDDNFRKLIEKYATPVGTIMMWSGSTASVPDGWCLCDGTARTDRNGASATVPDLRNRFVVCAGSSYAVDATGGSNTINVSQGTSTNGDHDHNMNGDISNTELERQHIPQHKHAINHSHVIEDPGHSHNLGVNNEGVAGGGGQVVDGITSSGGSSVSKENTGITTRDLRYPSDAAPSADWFCGYGGARDFPDPAGGFYNGLGPSNTPSNRGAGHNHNHNFDIQNNGSHSHNFNFNFDNRPEYYSIAYIFKL